MGLFGKKDKKAASNLSSKSQLKIDDKKDGAEYTLLLEGRLDTITSPSLEAKINEAVGDASKLILDLGSLDYISSAGKLGLHLQRRPARSARCGTGYGRQGRHDRPKPQSVCA